MFLVPQGSRHYRAVPGPYVFCKGCFANSIGPSMNIPLGVNGDGIGYSVRILQDQKR